MRATAVSSLLRPRKRLQTALLSHRIAAAPYTSTSTSTSTSRSPYPPPSLSPSPSTSPPLPPTSPPTAPFDAQSYLQHARKRLSHPPTFIADNLSPTPSHLLTLSLADHVPALFSADQLLKPLPSRLASPLPDLVLPQGHHLVYFPLQLPPSRLLPDGTDPAHCPGAPFVRRMWAGGELTWSDGWDRALLRDGRRAVCVETVGPPNIKGGAARPGDEKVFVDVVRRYGVGRFDDTLGRETMVDSAIGREVLEGGGLVLHEVRKLVFLREENMNVGRARRGVSAPVTPDFTFTLKPDSKLLFHFSALTYNAHAIHLDPDYVRTREGYRGLLIHGPLSLVLMLAAVRACMQPPTSPSVPDTPTRVPYIKHFSYRNLAPLYVDEEMKVCVRRTDPDGHTWSVWIEGPEGGLAVRGQAVMSNGAAAS